MLFSCSNYNYYKKTYGLFETESKASSNIPIAKWVIKVDGKDLSLDKELNYTDFTIDSNGHSDTAISPLVRLLLTLLVLIPVPLRLP